MITGARAYHFLRSVNIALRCFLGDGFSRQKQSWPPPLDQLLTPANAGKSAGQSHSSK